MHLQILFFWFFRGEQFNYLFRGESFEKSDAVGRWTDSNILFISIEVNEYKFAQTFL